MTGTTTGITVAIIPARGGSKGVPGKNLRRVGGVPLVERAVRAAATADGIDLVVVSTDDERIAAVAHAAGARTIARTAELSGDTASSESALLHALDVLEADGIRVATVVFVQATSPFLPSAGIAEAAAHIAAGRFDSVFSAHETYGFLWRRDGDGNAIAINHVAAHRPRRQDREPHYLETGAFYAFDAEGFRAAGHRFFGRIGIVEVPASTAIEIDDEQQLALADALARAAGDALAPHNIGDLHNLGTIPADGSETVQNSEQADAGYRADATNPAPAGIAAPARIPASVLVTDFDGVHTDDTAFVDSEGRETVRVSREDGMGVSRLRRAGIPMLILSTEQNPVVARRAEKLQVPVLHGVDDKASALAAWADENGIALTDIAYVGNDVNDLGPLGLVGWPIAVADAHPAVKAVARVVLSRGGGRGAVREVIERMLPH